MSDDPTPWDNATESATVSPACPCLSLPPLPTPPASGSRGRGDACGELWGSRGCRGVCVFARLGTAAAPLSPPALPVLGAVTALSVLLTAGMLWVLGVQGAGGCCRISPSPPGRGSEHRPPRWGRVGGPVAVPIPNPVPSPARRGGRGRFSPPGCRCLGARRARGRRGVGGRGGSGEQRCRQRGGGRFGVGQGPPARPPPLSSSGPGRRCPARCPLRMGTCCSSPCSPSSSGALWSCSRAS